MADDNIEYIDGDTGEVVSPNQLDSYDIGGQETTDLSEYEFIDGDTGKPVSTDRLDDYDFTDVRTPPTETPDNSPGWMSTIGNAAQKGVADLVTSGGQVLESAGHSFADPGTFWGDVGSGLENLGKSTKQTYEPYSDYSEQVLSQIPEDSWKKTTANVTEGMANMLPVLGASAGSLPAMIGYNALNRFGRTTKDLTEQGVPLDQAEKTGATSGVFNAPLDAFFMSPLFNPDGGALRKTAMATISTMAGAFPAKAADLYARYIGGVDQNEPTADKIFENPGETLLEAGASGLIMGGVTSMLHPNKPVVDDFFSNQSSREKINNWEGSLDKNAAEKAQSQALADAEMVIPEMPQAEPSQQIPDIIMPGDAPAQQPAGFTSMKDLLKQEVERWAKVVPPEASQLIPDTIMPEKSAGPLFDQAAAQKFANDNAATKMGATEPIPAPEHKTVTKTVPIKQPLAEDGGSVKISTTIVKPSMKPVSEGALDAVPTVRVSLDKIVDLPDVPNMKRRAVGKYGTIQKKEIPKGAYKGFPVKPITLLETIDGELGMVTGRHRRKGAIDSDRKDIAAQIVREADGYTREWARMFDAEENIRDGQGETDDYANYFRQAKLSPEEAKSRGLMRDDKGEQGYIIGTHAVQDVYDGYMNAAFSEDVAATIAKAAPGNEEAQRAGMELFFKGTKVEQLGNAIKEYQQLFSELPPENSPEAEQTEMFGSRDRIMNLVKNQANFAIAKTKAIDAEIYANRGAAKNPEGAKKGGVVVEDAKATKAYVDQLQAEKARWQNWRNDPELRAQLQKEFTAPEITSDPTAAAQKFDIVPDRQTGLLQLDNSADVFPDPIKKPFSEPAQEELIISSEPISREVKDSPLSDQAVKKNIKSRLLSESGAVRIDLPNPFTSNGFKDWMSRMRDKGFDKNPEFYNFFNSGRNLFAANFTKAEKFPWYRKSHETSLKKFEQENSISWDHDQMLRPFTLLNAKEKQNLSTFRYAALRQQQKTGVSVDMSPENLQKLGLSQREINANQAIANTMGSALESMRQLSIDKINRSGVSEEIKQQRAEEVNQSFDVMAASNFVPTGRYGKYALTIFDKSGKVSSVIMNDSKSKLQNTLYEAIRTDPNINPETSRINLVAKAIGSEYVGIHPDIVDIMKDGDAQIPSASFENRFKKRDLIAGFEADLQRNISSYLTSHAKYVSAQRAKMEFADHNKSFDAFFKTLGKRDKALYTGLRKNIQELQTYVNEPVASSKLSRAFAYAYLANSFKTITVNTTSGFTSTYPKIAKYTGYEPWSKKGSYGLPERIFMKANAQTALYYAAKSPEIVNKLAGFSGVKSSRGQDPNTNMWAGLELARKEGVVGGNRVFKDLLMKANTKTAVNQMHSFGQKISIPDIAFFGNGISEDFVRTHAYISGWNTYPYAKGFFKSQSARNQKESGYRGVDANGKSLSGAGPEGTGEISLPDRHSFAKSFIREAHHDYTPAGAPDFAKNMTGKYSMTFRGYTHSFLTSFKRSIAEQQFGAASRYIAATGIMGGLMAVPVAGMITQFAKNLGYDTDGLIQKGLEYFGVTKPMTAQMVTYGLPIGPSTNVNLSGATATEQIPAEFAKGDILAGGARLFAGVLADPIDRLGRAYYYYNNGDMGRALEQFVPPGLNLGHNVTANRWAKEGVLNSAGEDILGREPTEGELLRKRFGFTPGTIAAAMNLDRIKKNEAYSLKDNEGVNIKIAKAMAKGNEKDVEYWMNYAQEKGFKINPATIMESFKNQNSPIAADLNRFGRRNFDKAQELNQRYEDLINPK